MSTNPPATTPDSHGQHSSDELRFYHVRLSDRDAWFSAAVAALFNALGMLLEIQISRRTPGMSAKLPALSALVGLLLLLMLFI
jgi:hypothetical protein